MTYNFVVTAIENVLLTSSGHPECNAPAFEPTPAPTLRDTRGKPGGFRFPGSRGMHLFLTASLFNAGAERGFGGDFTRIRRLGSSCMFAENMEAEKLTTNV